MCQNQINQYYKTTETPETALVFVALGGEDWEADYISDLIFRSTYVKAKAEENKKHHGFWINSVATIHYHAQAGNYISLPED